MIDRERKQSKSLAPLWNELSEDVIAMSQSDLLTESEERYGDAYYFTKQARAAIRLGPFDYRKSTGESSKEHRRGSKVGRFPLPWGFNKPSFWSGVLVGACAIGLVGACLQTYGIEPFYVLRERSAHQTNVLHDKARSSVEAITAQIADGDQDEAMSLVNKAFSEGFVSAELFDVRGILLAELKLYDSALHDFDAAQENADERAWALNNQGVVKQIREYKDAKTDEAKHNTQAAIDNFTNALKISEFAMPHKNRGFILFSQEKYQDALDDFDAALRLAPGFVDALLGRAIVKTRINEDAKAVEDFTAIIRKYPRHAQFYELRGNAYLVLNKENEARRDFEAVRRLKPVTTESDFGRVSRLESPPDFLSFPAALPPSQNPRVPVKIQQSASEEEGSRQYPIDRFRETLYCGNGSLRVPACVLK